MRWSQCSGVRRGTGCVDLTSVENCFFWNGSWKRAMDRSCWIRKNKELLGSRFEERFVDSVLGMIPDIDYSCLEAQMPFRDQDGKQRYCDFVIREGAEVRIAIEVDG